MRSEQSPQARYVWEARNFLDRLDCVELSHNAVWTFADRNRCLTGPSQPGTLGNRDGQGGADAGSCCGTCGGVRPNLGVAKLANRLLEA